MRIERGTRIWRMLQSPFLSVRSVVSAHSDEVIVVWWQNRSIRVNATAAVVSQQALQYTIQHDVSSHAWKSKIKELGSSFLTHNYDIKLTGHSHGKLVTIVAICWARLMTQLLIGADVVATDTSFS